MSIVVPLQNEIQVFANGDGEVTIKMVSMLGEEQVVWFASSHAEAIVEAIRLAVDEIEGVE
jgi:hypothetical protein